MQNKILFTVAIVALVSSGPGMGSTTLAKNEGTSTNSKQRMANDNSTSNSQKSESTQNNKNQSQNANPISIILKDHARIRIGLARLNKQLNSNVADARNTFDGLKNFLIAHETMEQTIWYPELEKNSGLKNIIDELKKQETEASDMIKKIDGIKNDKEWSKEVRKLSEAVLQHAREEEMKLLPKAKLAIDPKTLNDIGIKMRDYKNQKGMM